LRWSKPRQIGRAGYEPVVRRTGQPVIYVRSYLMRLAHSDDKSRPRVRLRQGFAVDEDRAQSVAAANGRLGQAKRSRSIRLIFMSGLPNLPRITVMMFNAEEELSGILFFCE
jgi:hypothetical protein